MAPDKGAVNKIIIQCGYILFHAQMFNVKYFVWFQANTAISVFTSIFPTKIPNAYFLTHAHSTPSPCVTVYFIILLLLITS